MLHNSPKLRTKYIQFGFILIRSTNKKSLVFFYRFKNCLYDNKASIGTSVIVNRAEIGGVQNILPVT